MFSLSWKRCSWITVFLVLLSIVLAYFEIQVEGVKGWAASLPTWKYSVGKFEFTGYHVSLWMLLLVFVHMPCLFVPWSLRLECFLLSWYVLLLLLEDCWWFFLNTEFRQSGHYDTWRYPKLGHVPIFFLFGAVASVVLASASASVPWMTTVILLLVVMLITFPFQIVPKEN